MSKTNTNVLGKIAIILSLLALSLVPVVALAQTGFYVDGSTTVYPVVSVAKEQSPYGVEQIYYTGSSHGQLSIMNDFPAPSINIDLALSSSSCSTSNQVDVNPDAFNPGEYTTVTGSQSEWGCPGQSGFPNGTLTSFVVAKDALAIIKNNARVSSIPGCSNYITKAQVQAIWQGYNYTARTTPLAAAPDDAATRPASATGDTFYTPVRHTWAQIWPACAAEPWGNEQIVPVARVHESGTRDTFNDKNSFRRNNSSTVGVTFGARIYVDELLSMDPTGTLPLGGADPNGYQYFCNVAGQPCPGGYNPPLFGIAPRQLGNSQMNATIQANPNYLGYSSLAFTVGVTTQGAQCGGSSWACTGGATAGSIIPPTKQNAQNNTYPLARDLYMFTNSNSAADATAFANDMLTPRYQSIVANVGYVEVIPLNTNPPNWDIDLSGSNNSDIGDVVALGVDWRRTCPADPFDVENPTVRGCTRSDVTFDGTVDVSDISSFGGCWNKTWGPSEPNVAGCWDNVSGYPR